MRKVPLSSLILIQVLAAGCGNPVTQSSGAAACIVASACGLLLGTASACTQTVANVNDPQLGLLLAVELGLNGVVHITPGQVNCIAGAGTDCNRAKACLNNGITPPACSGNSSTCMGSVIVSCGPNTGSNGNNGQSTFDCATLGNGYTCVAANGNVDCGTASCGGGNPTQCSGNFAQRCSNGIFEQVDCTHFASTCVTTGLGAHCRGSGPSCTQMSTSNNPGATIRCDGSVLVSCNDGQEARYECGQQNLGCFPNPNNNGGYGCFAGKDCDPGAFNSTCANNVLTFCNKGKIDSFNCSGSGFSGCNAAAGTCIK